MRLLFFKAAWSLSIRQGGDGTIITFFPKLTKFSYKIEFSTALLYRTQFQGFSHQQSLIFALKTSYKVAYIVKNLVKVVLLGYKQLPPGLFELRKKIPSKNIHAVMTNANSCKSSQRHKMTTFFTDPTGHLVPLRRVGMTQKYHR